MANIGVKEVIENRKNFTEFYTKKISCHFSPFFTILFIKFGIRPNTVTYLMWLEGVLAAALLISHDSILRVLAALLLFLINILDTSDGEVARLTENTSSFGLVLDKLAHMTTNITIYLAISYYYYSIYNSALFLLLGVMMVLVTSLDDFQKELYLSEALKKNGYGSKSDLSYDRGSKIAQLVHITAGSTALYHIYALCILLDVFIFKNMAIQSAFLGYYLLVNFGKTCIRYSKIRKALSE